jgi:hypothetical protein
MRRSKKKEEMRETFRSCRKQRLYIKIGVCSKIRRLFWEIGRFDKEDLAPDSTIIHFAHCCEGIVNFRVSYKTMMRGCIETRLKGEEQNPNPRLFPVFGSIYNK